MLKTVPITLMLALASCGDDSDPLASDYGDAVGVWAEGYCNGAERCHPVEFSLFYGDHANCVREVTDLNCDVSQGGFDCTLRYPADLLDELEMCQDELADLSCSASLPESCKVAFGVN
jgi:hypothetical protein